VNISNIALLLRKDLRRWRAYWSAKPRLQALLSYGVAPAAPSSEAARYTLSELDLERYLQISPPVCNQRGQPETIVGFKIDQSATREDFTDESAPTFSETQAYENSPAPIRAQSQDHPA
jgi:hypothetical protein